MARSLVQGLTFLPLLLVIVPGVRLPLTDANLRSVVGHFFNDSATAAILKRYKVRHKGCEPQRRLRPLLRWSFADIAFREVGVSYRSLSGGAIAE